MKWWSSPLHIFRTAFICLHVVGSHISFHRCERFCIDTRAIINDTNNKIKCEDEFRPTTTSTIRWRWMKWNDSDDNKSIENKPSILACAEVLAIKFFLVLFLLFFLPRFISISRKSQKLAIGGFQKSVSFHPLYFTTQTIDDEIRPYKNFTFYWTAMMTEEKKIFAIKFLFI